MVLFIVYCSWNMGHMRFLVNLHTTILHQSVSPGGDLSGGAGDNAVNFTTGRWTRWGLETGQGDVYLVISVCLW